MCVSWFPHAQTWYMRHRSITSDGDGIELDFKGKRDRFGANIDGDVEDAVQHGIVISHESDGCGGCGCVMAVAHATLRISEDRRTTKQVLRDAT